MSSDSAKAHDHADYKNNSGTDGKTTRSSSLTVGGLTSMKTTDEVMATLQYYIMVFILGIEGYIPQCHWMHNVLVYIPVCFSAFPYLCLCMYFTDLDNTHRVAKVTNRIVEQSFVNAFTFVAIRLGGAEVCESHIRVLNRVTAVVLFTGTCLVSYFRLKELVETVNTTSESRVLAEPEIGACL